MRNQDRINTSVKVTKVDNYTYIGLAPPGSNEADPVWQALRVDKTSGTIIKYADGNDNFDNIATDLTALTYE